MICDKCNCEMMITNRTIEVTGDDTPKEQTEVYNVLTFACRNSKCSECGKEKQSVRNRIYPKYEKEG